MKDRMPGQLVAQPQGLLIPKFDEATHRYTLNGKVLPSVTEILKSAGLINGSWYTEESRVFGKTVHLACQLYDENDLDEDSIGDSIRPRLNGWIKFRSETGFTPDLIEQPIASKRGFCGTPDAVDYDVALIDRKTGAFEPWHQIQSAMYRSMLHNPFIRGWAVYLNDRGTYTLREHPKTEYISDLNVGLNALAIYNWKARTNGR